LTGGDEFKVVPPSRRAAALAEFATDAAAMSCSVGIRHRFRRGAEQPIQVASPRENLPADPRLCRISYFGDILHNYIETTYSKDQSCKPLK